MPGGQCAQPRHERVPVVISRYENPHQRVATSAGYVILSAGLIFVGVAPLAELPGLQGVPLGVPWMAIWAGLTYMVFLRKPFSMELTATEFRWHTMFQVKSCPLGQVEAIRITRVIDEGGLSYVALIRLSGRRRRLAVQARRSWAGFAADIKAAAPHVTMTAPDDWPPPPRRRRRGRPSGEE
jgi:hypothetical protein